MVTAEHREDKIAIIVDGMIVEAMELDDAVEFAQMILNECGKIDNDNV